MLRFELIIRLVVVAAILLTSFPPGTVSANPGRRLIYQITEPPVPSTAAAPTKASPTKNPISLPAGLPAPAFAATLLVSSTETITPTETIFLPLITRPSSGDPVDAPHSNLIITKMAPTTATAGTPITYTLRITNSGPAPAANLVITDAIPSGANYVSGGTAVIGNVVSWTLPSLASGAVVQASFVVTAATTITNSSYRVSASGGISATGTTPVVTVIEFPPKANVTANPQTGPVPLTVTFTSDSTRVTSYLWDFGDGITSTLMSPAHTFTRTGVYTVTLNARGPGGNTTTTTIITATDEAISEVSVINDSPTALNQATTFTSVVTLVQNQATFSGIRPDRFPKPVRSSPNKSSVIALGSNVIYSWDFGDGSQVTGNERVVTHTYLAIGSYTAVVTASNSVSVVTATTPVSIIGVANLAIGKSAPISVIAGDPITYTLTVSNSGTLTATNLVITDALPADANYVSGGAPTADIVSWAFDSLSPGSSTTMQFVVTATETITNSDYEVSGDNGVAAVGQEAIVTLVYPLVAVDFAANPLTGTAPLTVTFANSSTNAIIYLWDFGDTMTSTEVNPTHTYTQAGIYPVTLAATGLSGSQTLPRPNYLTVYEPVVAEFAATPLTGTVPLTVAFSNTSMNATQYLWDFGDGFTDIVINPIHVYTQPGAYTVTLIASDGVFTNSLTQSNIITAYEPIITGFSADPFTGPAPLLVTFITSSTHGSSYLWDFGDGSTLLLTSTFTSPITTTHLYTQAGVYRVTLSAGNGPLTDTLTLADDITVIAPIRRTWQQVTTTTPPPPIIGEHSLAYDSDRNKGVLYGGNAVGWPYENTTWEFDRADWISVTTMTNPEARYGAGLAYDPVRQVMVLFGGSDETDTALNQTWEYTNTAWLQIFPVTSPLSRTYHSLATNPVSGDIYLFGGNQSESHLDDLWIYQSGGWSEIQVSGTRPVSRTLAAMTYDTHNNRLLLFGGRSAAGTLLADLWAFDPVTETWQELADGGGGGPSARMAHTLTYDVAARNVVLVGGVAGDGDALLNDTWHYRDQTGWLEATTSALLPGSNYHQAVYDGNAIIMFSNGEVWKYE